MSPAISPVAPSPTLPLSSRRPSVSFGGFGLTQATREENPRVWNKTPIFVEAAESPVATIVSFVIADHDLEMRFNIAGESPSFPVGVLAAQSGKRLWVIARYASEGNMKEMALRGIRSIDTNMVEQLRDMSSGHVLGLCVTGLTKEGGAFMMPFPAQMHWNEAPADNVL